MTTPDQPPTTLLRWVRAQGALRARWLQAQVAGAKSDLDRLLEDDDDPAAESAWRADQPPAAEPGLWADDTRLGWLARVFELNEDERDALAITAALAIDPALARLFAVLGQGTEREGVTAALVARLVGRGARTLLLRRDGGALGWQLLHERAVLPGEAPLLTCDGAVVRWLLGRYETDDALADVAALHPARAPLPSWPVEELGRQLEAGRRQGIRLRLVGPPGSGRRTLAAALAARFDLPLLVVDLDAVDDADLRRTVLRAERQAFLHGCALAWQGERSQRASTSTSASAATSTWPRTPASFPIQFVIAEGHSGGPPCDRHFELPAPTLDERRALWREHLGDAGADIDGDVASAALEPLVRRVRATPGDIAAAARAGNLHDVQAALRHRARGQLGALAEPLDAPFAWDDLVVPAPLRDALEDIVHEAQTRAALWEEPEARRLFPQGRALMGLFSGPPGTGKTMAAQVIARALGLDLFRIDLSSVVSKWVGETAQNLERLLERARRMDAILFFDEADALYGKRVTDLRDAQDRFANMDSSHLMVAIESYDGIVLLASNLKNQIDPAFVRRLRYSLDFPKPGPTERLEIWRRMVTALTGMAAARVAGKELAQLAQFEATGAQIKNAVLGARFIASREGKPLRITHLMRGLDREFSKDGYALSPREKERVTRAS